MQKVLALMIVLCMVPTIFASESEPETFDVQSGKYQRLFEGLLEPNHLIYCDFEITEKHEGTEWPSAVNVGFSTTESARTNEDVVRLSASPTNDGNGWTYELWIYEKDYASSFIILAPGRSDSILRLNLARSDDGRVMIRAGNIREHTSVVDFSRLPLKYWHVSVTGVKGNVLCGDDPSQYLPN